MVSKVLDLSLKPHWFDEIKYGRKKKEYRDFNNLYYVTKLLRYGDYVGYTNEAIRSGIKKGTLPIKAIPYTHVRFHCGNQSMLVEFKGLSHEGNNWVIELGNVSKQQTL